MSDTCYEQSLLSIKAACSFAHLPIYYRHESFHISACWLFAEVRARYRFLFFFSLFSLIAHNLRLCIATASTILQIPCSMMTRDYYERLNWVIPTSSQVHDLRYTSAHCNLGNPPSKKKQKRKQRNIFCRNKRSTYIYLGSCLTPIAVAM